MSLVDPQGVAILVVVSIFEVDNGDDGLVSVDGSSESGGVVRTCYWPKGDAWPGYSAAGSGRGAFWSSGRGSDQRAIAFWGADACGGRFRAADGAELQLAAGAVGVAVRVGLVELDRAVGGEYHQYR